MKQAFSNISHRSTKMLKVALRVIVGLGISLSLTILCALYIPSVFNKALYTGLEILPKYKFLEYKVQTQIELTADRGLNAKPGEDALMFEQLEDQLPISRDKSTFFARMLIVQDYPEQCQFTLIGKHRTLDLSWQVVGLRCHDKQSCEQAYLYQICPQQRHGENR